MNPAPQIGIFGGTFNPIHQGHLAIAEDVLKTVGLDRILFIPAGRPPHKKGHKILPPGHRLEMVRLAVQDHPGFEVSDLEVGRSGKSFTIDTVESLEKSHPKGTRFYLILGLDAFLDFSSWRAEKELRSRCHFIVVSRPGFRFADLGRLPFLKGVSPESLRELDAGGRLRHDHPLSPRTQMILVRVTARDISATEIRSHLSGGKRLKNLLPPPVESYIIRQDLYGRITNSS